MERCWLLVMGKISKKGIMKEGKISPSQLSEI
jgi:hypothetical protein